VRDVDAVRAGIGVALDHTRRIDLLVNNAGVGLVGAARKPAPTRRARYSETNFFDTVSLTSAVLPAMRAQRRRL